MANKNSNARCIIVLVAIAIICVASLATLNDVLYVPPDMSVFNKAVDGEYQGIDVEKMTLKTGKVTMVAEGTLTSGEDVVGIYMLGSKYGKSDGYEIAVVVEKESGIIKGAYEAVDGGTGGYSWGDDKLSQIVGKDIKSIDFFGEKDLLQTGATNSSIAVQNALTTAKDYYMAVFQG